MTAWYNDNDPRVCAWLRELIARNLIAPGVVDDRSIHDVTARDLAGFTQCHFFAGIGGWSRALRLAGWSDDLAVWSGSCPCQPFSASGQRGGTDDHRHLWPAWHRLIRECRPDVVFGEQVASKAGLAWLDFVSTDLEDAGYAIGAADLCAASVGAPHIRQRLWFVAESDDGRCGRIAEARLRGRRESSSSEEPAEGDADGARGDDALGRGGLGDVADTDGSEPGRGQFGLHPEGGVSDGRAGLRQWEVGSVADADRHGAHEFPRVLPSDEGQYDIWATDGDHAPVANGATGVMADAAGGRREQRSPEREASSDAGEAGARRIVGDAAGERSARGPRGGRETQHRTEFASITDIVAHPDARGLGSHRRAAREFDSDERLAHAEQRSPAGVAHDASGARFEGREQRGARHDNGHGPQAHGSTREPGAASGFWADAQWIPCRDGKARAIEPGTQPLAHGIPARVVRLRGYGNAIVPPLAAEFIQAYLELTDERRAPAP